jgi:predicted HAD superfamily Cof-like phosphohydrolase
VPRYRACRVPEAAWRELLDATPPGWYVGRPSYQDERREWLLYAFDPSERPAVGIRKREWTAIAPTEVEVVLEASRRERELIEEEVAELRAAVAASDIVEIADALGDIVWVTIEAALALGIPIEEVFEEIHRSNLTKLQGERSYAASGKLVGGTAYVPPDLSPILAAHGASERDLDRRRRTSAAEGASRA